MIVSVNWLKKFTDIDIPIEELARLIDARLVEIEDIIDLGAKYKGAIVARVAQCRPLEGSDHLSIVRLDDGGAATDVERGDDGLVQVVCGAPNVREGILVAWLVPGATVPETYGTKEPFVLGSRKLRGVMSNGMIASPRELGLSDEHEGILELDSELTPGQSFASAYDLDDYLLDIENKSLTHRPDCFGIVGFAREVAAIQGKAFHTPEWLDRLTPDYGEKQGDVSVPSVLVDPELSSRYQAVVLSNVDAHAKSPIYIQSYLMRSGVRPLSGVVDITNYLMLLTGQPLHAFDYDKLVALNGDSTVALSVRAGHANETLVLLDGRSITLSPEDIVVSAGDKAVALAGAMGGGETEIDATTKTVIIESATFNLYNLRATQMRHGIFSEALTRFTKGQPADLTAPVLAQAVELLQHYAGARRASDVADAYPVQHKAPVVSFAINKVNEVLGSVYSTDDILSTLRNVELEAHETNGELTVTSPYWRADIHIEEDIIEEIGRIGGFDSITPTLPSRDFTAVRPLAADTLRTQIRDTLARAGANEVLTYSFIHGDVLKKAGQDPANSYRITNSISPELQYYRQSLTPSLLGLVHGNSKAGYDEFALFELNKTHSKSGELVEGVPPEMHRIGLVYANKKSQKGAAYYQAKRILEYLAKELGMQLSYVPIDEPYSLSFMRPFDTRRSARIIDEASKQSIGIVGEYTSAVARAFKLPEYAAGFELLTEALELALRHRKNTYRPLSRYPGTERDICFQVTTDVSYDQIVRTIRHELATISVHTNVLPVDIYQPDQAGTKNITVRITYQADTHTLVSDEVAQMTQKIADAVVNKTGGKVI